MLSRTEFQSAPKGTSLKEAIVPPKIDGLLESNPNIQPSLSVYSLCDPPQNYLESNASSRRSSSLSHRKAPRRKNHLSQIAVSQNHLYRPVHFPQLGTFALNHVMKLQLLLARVTDVQFGDDLCNIPAPRKHAVLDTWIPACKSLGCNQNR